MEVCTEEIENIYWRQKAMQIKQLNYQMMKMKPRMCMLYQMIKKESKTLKKQNQK